MPHREHRRAAKRIDAWVDSELDDASARRVAAHVRRCWTCSSAAETARLVKEALRARRDTEPRRLAAVRLERFARRLAGSTPR